jgi:hypothetical protein
MAKLVALEGTATRCQWYWDGIRKITRKFRCVGTGALLALSLIFFGFPRLEYELRSIAL